MTYAEDAAEKSFYTEQGLRLRAISPEEFHEDRPHALTPLQIEENLIYEARGWSKRLEAVGAAASFNVMSQRRLPQGAQIHRLYLVSNNDTTFDSIVHTKSSIDAQAHNA